MELIQQQRTNTLQQAAGATTRAGALTQLIQSSTPTPLEQTARGSRHARAHPVEVLGTCSTKGTAAGGSGECWGLLLPQLSTSHCF
jgi:hypothetical protein